MYRHFGLRFKSFDRMPSKGKMNIFLMALCGLFYVPAEGERASWVQCAFCSFWLEHFDATTDWCLMHATRNPFCIHFLAFLGVVKICQILQNANYDNRTINLFKKNLFVHGIKPMLDDETRSESNHVSTYTSTSGAKFSLPVDENMTEFYTRLSTLYKMPENFRRTQNLEHFAEAGFYFDIELGQQDGFLLRCFYCGIEIRYYNNQMWNYRDPWRAHVSVKRQCFYNILMRGNDFTLTDIRGTDGQYLCDQNGQEKNFGRRKTCFMCRRNDDQPHMYVHLCCGNSVCNECTTGGPCPSCNGNVDGRKTCFSCRRSVEQSHVCVHLCCDISVCNECTIGGPCPNCNGEYE